MRFLVFLFLVFGSALQAQERRYSHCIALAEATPGMSYVHLASFRDPVERNTVRIRYLDHSAFLIQTEGGLSVVCYPGHETGAIEAEAVEKWFNDLPSKGWRVAKYAMLGTQKPAPFLLLGVKGG